MKMGSRLVRALVLGGTVAALGTATSTAPAHAAYVHCWENTVHGTWRAYCSVAEITVLTWECDGSDPTRDCEEEKRAWIDTWCRTVDETVGTCFSTY